MRILASFFVEGLPAPSGSKNAFVVTPKSGKPRAVVAPASKKQKVWQAVVADTAEDYYEENPYDGPVVVTLTFFFERPKSHYGTGKNSQIVKSSAPYYHTVKPDVDKLARSTLDALSGIVFVDDKQVVSLSADKTYADQSGCNITVREAWE